MFTEILAHIHPIIVHFPIALIIIGCGYDAVLAVRRRALPPGQGLWLWLLAAAGAWAAIATGPDDDARGVTSFIEPHETLATLTAWTVTLIAAWRLLMLWKGNRAFVRIPLALYIAVSVASCGLVLGTGYYGGKMVYTDGVGVSANGAAVNPPHSSSHRGG
ncbi:MULTISPECIES: DUF2231 domain-containing protein [unclassified Paenibacillus]|uniref:DUF2231 domain-containing protein n=1 Tax=unclassified Paenibacillus TaxID=185978 RepID=UPI0003E27F5E|nr:MULTISPECIES: DUF2231 domain-containing protein [unclassified Paenibacillus]ETT33620.1 hypothetical protein C162_30742 [Paenibacillus sp. FSL R7-269]OMF95451.1 hypothetical protein BK147_14415 [Paenibacillus sp. FSL R7-0337]